MKAKEDRRERNTVIVESIRREYEKYGDEMYVAKWKTFEVPFGNTALYE